MGVEPTASRVRFQDVTRHHPDTTRKLRQIKTHVAECRRVFGYFTRSTALVHGQKVDNLSFRSGDALLIEHLMVCSNPKPHKIAGCPEPFFLALLNRYGRDDNHAFALGCHLSDRSRLQVGVQTW
jgi:hypothetical protein